MYTSLRRRGGVNRPAEPRARPVPADLHVGSARDFLRRHGAESAEAARGGRDAKMQLFARLLPRAADPRNLRVAIAYLACRGGTAPGPNGRRLGELDDAEVWSLARALGRAIRSGTYRPGPHREVAIPKASGKGTRTLKVQDVEDRVVQRGIVQVLQSLKNDFRDENCSTFCELIATEVTTRTHCDPRDPQVAEISIRQRFEIRMFTCCRQFILFDQKKCDWDDLAWTEGEERDLIAFGKTVVGIGTVEDWTRIPIVIEVHDRPATPEELNIATTSSTWHHITEGCIHVPSGRLSVSNTEIGFEVPIEIRVVPGRHRVRAFYGALDHQRGEPDSDSAAVRPDDGRSFYVVQLWPTERGLRRRVLKRWDPAGPRPPAAPSPAGADPAGKPETVTAPASAQVPEPAAAGRPSGEDRPTGGPGPEPVDGERDASVRVTT